MKYPALFTVVLGVINIIGLILISEKSTIDTMSVIKLMLFFSVFIIIVQSYGVNAFFFNRIYPGNAGQIKFVFLKIVYLYVFRFALQRFYLKFTNRKI